MQKVIYHKGNNLKNDYFIKAEKKQVKIVENSLAFKLDDDNEDIYIIDEPGFTGNFDYILQEIDKITSRSRYIPCFLEDIKL